MNWALLKRYAITLALLSMAILGTVVIGLHIADNEWPSPFALISCPMWWWSSIRRIAQDVVTEARKELNAEV